jgi:3-oxoacyl-[acyl-carrier-protein] synthase II
MSDKGDNMHDVVVTGLGPVTSIGIGNEAFWASLAAGRCKVARRTLLVDVGTPAEMPIASMPGLSEVSGFESHIKFLASQGCENYRDLGYTLFAIDLALRDAGIQYEQGHNRLGVVQAFEAPGMERTVAQMLHLLAAPMPADGPPQVYGLFAPLFYNMQPFMYVHLVGKALGLHGFSTSVHNACASGAFALEIAAQHIRSGQADVMIVAGGEAFDTAVRLEWFRRLELYSLNGSMRPFDSEPSGFYVGEGAAAIVLESAEHAAARGAQPIASYLGGAFAHQGWKQSIPDIKAGRLRGVIVDALKLARVAADEIDLIVPHGASTMLSDAYEATCLAQALAQKHADAVATVFKPYVGHMLASSTLIELVCALLAVRHQAVPPTLNTRPDHAPLAVPLVTDFTQRHMDTVLKLSTGFTGHDAALVFRRE